MERLKSVKEGDGNLLDHSMIVYGSGNGDGDRHNHDDLPILLAGKGCGTIKQGRHLVYSKETPLNNLWVSMLNRMDIRDVQSIEFGVSSIGEVLSALGRDEMTSHPLS